MKRVLIMGATGVFGARLAQHLAHHSPFELVLAARNAARLAHLSGTLPGEPRWVALDRASPRLADLDPWAVVDCSGPFQSSDYSFAQACIESRAHFVDLADAKDYLLGFGPALDATARTAGVTALSGASSTPALSGAVVNALTKGWQQIDTVDIAITPGGRSEVGPAVVKAILSYAGRPIEAHEHGRTTTVIGWRGTRLLNIPGLGLRRVSPVETADIALLAPRVTDRITFSAGLESPIEQRGLNLIASLRAKGLCPDPTPLLPLFLAARRLTRLATSDTGAMHVEVSGHDGEGQRRTQNWTLIARNNHGPYVPIMATSAALSAFASGTEATGARIATPALGQVVAEMAPYEIATSFSGLEQAKLHR